MESYNSQKKTHKQYIQGDYEVQFLFSCKWIDGL